MNDAIKRNPLNKLRRRCVLLRSSSSSLNLKESSYSVDRRTFDFGKNAVQPGPDDNFQTPKLLTEITSKCSARSAASFFVTTHSPGQFLPYHWESQRDQNSSQAYQLRASTVMVLSSYLELSGLH